MKKLRTRKHRVVLSRSIGGDFGVTIFMLLLGVVMFFPMYYLIIQSLKPLDELFYFPPRMYVTNPSFENFSDLFNLLNTSWVPFSRYLFNTVFITVCGTFGNLILSSMCAYALSKLPFPGHKFTFQVIQKSLMINSEVAQLMVFVIISKLGMLDSYWAIIIPALATPLGLYLMKQFIDSNVSTEILESARLDGAGEFRTFWSIAMPMVKPAWLTLIIYSFQGLWNTGQNIYIYSEQLKTLNFTINQVLLEGIVRSGASAAATVVMMIVPIVVFVISQSRIIETMGSSGMKD
ncbi:MAG: carbohydrate ABC transporter permease [Clostridiales bacterium]|jgi:ABC-type glycerol-3-phosphate transport system permease component|nr:carbohydrate ABC transporter permease [Clostridiales bacterium]